MIIRVRSPSPQTRPKEIERYAIVSRHLSGGSGGSYVRATPLAMLQEKSKGEARQGRKVVYFTAFESRADHQATLQTRVLLYKSYTPYTTATYHCYSYFEKQPGKAAVIRADGKEDRWRRGRTETGTGRDGDGQRRGRTETRADRDDKGGQERQGQTETPRIDGSNEDGRHRLL